MLLRVQMPLASLWARKNFKKLKVKYPRILRNRKTNKLRCRRSRMPKRQDSREVWALKDHRSQADRSKESP